MQHTDDEPVTITAAIYGHAPTPEFIVRVGYFHGGFGQLLIGLHGREIDACRLEDIFSGPAAITSSICSA